MSCFGGGLPINERRYRDDDKSQSQQRNDQVALQSMAGAGTGADLPRVLDDVQIDGVGASGDNDVRSAGQSVSARKKLLHLVADFFEDDGQTVNYDALRQSSGFREFEHDTVDLITTTVPNDADTRKAFFLNIYNSLCVHALALYGPPNMLTRGCFYKNHKYNVGGLPYSLDDIEHGILRNNSNGRFPQNDGRRPFVLPLDPRIHFALNCGARGCPAIRVYTATNLSVGMDQAARVYLRSGVVQLTEGTGGGTVKLTKLMQWYASDFGETVEDRLRWVMPFLEDADQGTLTRMLAAGTPRVSYLPYDWSVNASRKS